MPAPYSLDLRRKVLNAYFQEGSLRNTAKRFGVSYKFVQGLVKRYNTENTMEPKPHKGGKGDQVIGDVGVAEGAEVNAFSSTSLNKITPKDRKKKV